MRAILSVYDKTGVVDLARGLEALGFELFSTGGTEGLLREAGVRVRGVQELTGFPEMLGGRVKTLHPAVHGGILALRDDPGHLEELARHGLQPIDVVASNLYPFLNVVREPGARLSAALENIGFGGPVAWQVALLQQHIRRGPGLAGGERLHVDLCGNRQAWQPVRSEHWRERRRCVPQSPGDRSANGVWQRGRRQPGARRRSGA